MPDEMERATDISAAWTERNIATHRAALTQPGTLECTVCGEEIPAARRAKHASARHCVPCLEAMEKPRVR